MTTKLIPADLIQKMRDHEDFKDSAWQALMSVIYDEREDASPWSYTDLVNYAKYRYSDFAAFCVLLGKYNQQVENGGHSQYFDNSYSGERSRRCSCKHHRIELHDTMMKYMAQFQFETTEFGKQVFQIMSEFAAYINSNNRYDDADYYYDNEDDDCGVLDNLDDRYYAINDAWHSFIDSKITEVINV